MSTADDPDALTRRIEQLAAAALDEPDTEGAALTALVGALRADIGAVRAELGSLRAETRALRGDLDGLGGQLTGSVAAGRSETGTLVQRVAELSTRVDGVGGRIDDARTGLPGLSRELTGTLGDAAAALDDARGALEARLAALEDALDAMSERIEALARDGASTTTARLETLQTGVTTLAERIESEGRDNTELVVGRLREVTETRVSELEDTLFDRLSDVLENRDDALRRDMLAAIAAGREQATEDRAAVAELAGSVRSALEGFGSVLDRSLTGLGRSVGAALSESGAQSRTELEDVTARLLADVTARIDGLETGLTALGEQLTVLDVTVDERQADVVDRLGELGDAVTRSASATERTVASLVDVSASTESLTDTVEGFRSEWPTRTFEVVQGAKAVAEGVVSDVRAEVGVQLEQVRAELARAVDGVADARTGLSSGTDRLSRAGKVLVAYLEQRDRLLEAERDRVLHEVLDAFSSGLSAKERTALSSRVADAVDRRRDARDADRYRTAVGAPVPPVVDLPGDVLALEPLSADEAAADAEERRTARRPAAGRGPAPTRQPGRARVDAMPEARSPGVALDAAAPRPGAATAGPDEAAGSASDESSAPSETSWATRAAEAAPPPDDADDDTSVRRLFRRQRP